ncbi:hypothetical protein NKR19_g3397 [Coniochaeta hoffmannii]|uniref:Required for respiratory growth protein 9, mitochondrial n=1 Tax=Coniochaeta hoffmannii TaxID=91930 RepID=A0AA38RUK7_9PEZI|nr:hypothetical protein NKR19_g3397 [Coniochaeta hoffmannii]
MSSTAASSDDTTSQDEPADDATTAATDGGKTHNDDAAPRFPKALKAKKKEKKLAERLSQEPKESEVSRQETQESATPSGELETLQSPEGLQQQLWEPTSPRAEEAKPRKEKIPKNKRKREARAAAAVGDGKKDETGRGEGKEDELEAQRLGKPDRGKRQAEGQEQPDGRKSAGRDVRSKGREVKKADATEPELTAKAEPWQVQKAALKEKFPEGWSPRKRLSPDALAGIRALHQQFPEEYTTEVLANKFEVSPEAIRRILKSKWEPAPDEEVERQERWFNRGKRIWSAWAEEGKKPPTKWRKEGITRDPSYHEQRRARSIAQRKLAKTLM